MYFETTPGTFVPWNGERLPDGTLLPANIETAARDDGTLSWSASALANLGLYRDSAFAAADPIPEGKVADGEPYRTRVDGVLTWVQPFKNAPQPTKPERKALLVERIRRRRWQAETGGIVFNSIPISTDDKTQTRVTGAVAFFANDPEAAAVDWEVAPGQTVPLDGPTVQALGVAIGRHIQACFSRATALFAALSAADTHADIDAVEAQIDTGWP